MKKGELWVEWKRTNHLVLVEITSDFQLEKSEHVEGVIISGPGAGDSISWNQKLFRNRFKRLDLFRGLTV